MAAAGTRRVVSLLWSLRDLAGLARRIEEKAAERFAEAPADRNVEATRRLLAVALDLVGRIGALYEEERPGMTADLEDALDEMFREGGEDLAEEAETTPVPPPVSRGRDGEETPGQRVASLAAIAALELRERLEGLAVLAPADDPLEALAHASHARGAFLRAAIALEKLVCAAEGLRPRLASPQDVRRALAIRAAYADIARALCEEDPGDETREPTPECIGRAAEAVGQLLSCPLTKDLRIADRIALAKMYRRLRAHVEARGRDEAAERLHTWQDLRGLFEMLLLVNNRQELREHDHEAARWLLEQLPLAGPARLGERERGVLALLADREPALRVAESELPAPRVAVLRRTLLRIARELAPTRLPGEPAPA